jgi:hypothetical protein
MSDSGRRLSAAAGMTSATLTAVFGILHPKGTSSVGTVDEWLTRIHGSDVWLLVHFMLLWSSILALAALIGIARSFGPGRPEAWARLGLVVGVVATAMGVLTFLIDGAALKVIADRWAASPGDAGISGAALLATVVGFVLVAGVQLTLGATAFCFAVAGLAGRDHPRWLGWLAAVTAVVGIVPGAAHYLLGSSTWTANASYLVSGLFAFWLFAMSYRAWRLRSTEAGAYSS